MGITAAVAGVATAVSAGVSAYGSSKAAGAQTSAAQQAQQYLQNNFNLAQSNFQPYVTGGQGAFNQLTNLTGAGPGGNPLTAPLTAPFNPTMQQLEGTPGYKFTLGQGLQAVQNTNSAQGLGKSGSALAGAASFASGLASNTYQQQFQNYWGQNQSIYNMLGGIANTGLTATNNLGAIGTTTAQGQGSAAEYAGNAQAAGINSAYGAGASAINTLGGLYGQSQYFNLLKNANPQLYGAGAGANNGAAAAAGLLPTNAQIWQGNTLPATNY